MKKLLILMALFTSTVNAEEIPDYLKEGEITVKLKNGKTYTYSTNEYKVVKRGNPVLLGASPVTVSESSKKGVESENQKKKSKHIISGEISRSFSGRLNTSTYSNETEIEVRKRTGVGIMYQYNFVDNLYLGGRIDSNGGVGINLGLGF